MGRELHPHLQETELPLIRELMRTDPKREDLEHNSFRL